MPEENHRESSDGVFRFGEYELDPKRGVLSRGGVPLKIQPQPLRVLDLLLLRAPGFYLDIFVGALIVGAVILNQTVQGRRRA